MNIVPKDRPHSNPSYLFPSKYSFEQPHPRRYSTRLADALVAAPTAADERYFCEDVSSLEDVALLSERERLRIAGLLYGRSPRWAQGRIACLLAEEVRRGI